MRLPVLVLVCLALGCGPRLDESQFYGEKGVLVFSLADCLSCNPVGLRVGSEDNNIKVRRVEGPFADLEDIDPFGDLELMRGTFYFDSDDTTIVTTRADNADNPTTFWANAHTTGRVRVAVEDEEREEIDSTYLKVFTPTKLELYTDTAGRTPISELRLDLDQEKTPHVKVSCDEGSLVAASPFTWFVADASIAALWDPGASLINPDTYTDMIQAGDSFVYVKGRSPGTTTLTVRAGEVETAISVQVQ